MSATPVFHSDPWLDSLKGLLFPPACLICNRFMGLSAQGPVCLACKPQLPLTHNAPLTPDESGGVLNGVFFLYRYGRAARRLVHRMKMTGDPRAGTWLESELRRTSSSIPLSSFDAVVPVPSHRRRYFSTTDRDASVLWANALGSFFNAPIRTALTRSRTVPKQTSLTRERRLAASESSLAVRADLLRGCGSILLADDVMTTGATARACARALKKSGVRRVTLAVIARG